MLKDILLQVHKPARYIGKEWNVSGKDFSAGKIKFALCFPDLYEIGMSNLGIRILYGILNSQEAVVCERFFSPGPDLENILRDKRQSIFSLESRNALSDFDLVGFSLGYELCYTNVLNLLDLSGIPLFAAERGHNYPLVIGGGPCVLNPEPLHEFFDLFVIGEAEDVILEIVSTYRRYAADFKNGGISKEELLVILAQIEGVYVPSLYRPEYDAAGKIKEFKALKPGLPLKIKKRFVADLGRAYFPLEWVVPYIEIVHDRLTLEIMRGCAGRCRFCQARTQYFPFRQRTPEQVVDLACRAYKTSGYEEMSLLGLSVSDYPGIEELLKTLIGLFRRKGVNVSLPSLKARSLVGNLSALIATVKKTGLTFAPEAGTERLRGIIAKDFDEKVFFSSLEEVYLAGYRQVKLYFMLGLPGEAREDLDGIIDFSLRVSEAARKIRKMPAHVNISVNTLIPKPHTPLQWCAMEALETIEQKQDYLKAGLKNKRQVRISTHDSQMSFLEAVLSRGDRRLSRVIALAFKKGARFDAWSDYFNFALWQEAFRECGLDPGFYLKEKAAGEYLPWDFLDLGMSRESLREEFQKAIARE